MEKKKQTKTAYIILAVIVAVILLLGGLAAGLMLGRGDSESPTEPTDPTGVNDPTEATDPTNGTDPTVPNTGYRVPEGCTYTTADGTIYAAGDAVSTSPRTGDTFETADYIYKYNYELYSDSFQKPEWRESPVTPLNGWGVSVKDRTKTQYGPLENSINCADVVSLSCTFYGCDQMTVAPQLPASAREYYRTFSHCMSLETAPAIPEGVTRLMSTFAECKSLTETPYFPESILVLNNTFVGCRSLTKVTNFPSRLISLTSTFGSCFALTEVPALPETLEEISYAFQSSGLVTAPVIPEKVQYMAFAFADCENLTGVIEINAVLADDQIPCNGACDYCADGIYISCDNCEYCCRYSNCFYMTTRLPITLTGTCPMLEKIAATASNVTLG